MEQRTRDLHQVRGVIMDSEVLQELREIKRRVASIEEQLFRTHRTRRCIERVISKWPGPFTVQQIQQALQEFHPDVWAGCKPHAVDNLVHRLERAGIVSRANQGTGCVASVFERLAKIPESIGRPGKKFNRQADYESGFRHIVRSALDDLPEQFALADIRQWVEKHMAGARIPYGSWSSTLYKLTQSQELVCVKGRGTHCSTERKVFTRGPKRVAPSGDEVRQLESAWMEFRRTMSAEKT